MAKTRWGTERTEAFSDGVFAIAITLLVLDLAVPEKDFDNLWRGIAHLWPAYLGYATSFLTIGGIWMSHHGLFSRLRFVDRAVMRLNLLLLMVVAFLPFPTRLASLGVHQASAERAAVIFYGAVLLVISVLLSALWRAAAVHPDLLQPDVTAAELRRIGLYSTPRIGLYVVFILVALPAPRVAAIGYFAMALLGIVTAKGDDERADSGPHDSRGSATAGDEPAGDVGT